MLANSKPVTTLKLAHEFFAILDEREFSLEASDRTCLAQHGIEERRFREEIYYLRAFAVYYATCVTLGESPSGTALRAAFMGIWDKAARTNPEKMRSYNEFFRRIYLYAEAMAAESSAVAGQFTDGISRKLANLLSAAKDPSLLALSKAYASDCFASTSKVIREALKANMIAA